MYIPKHFEENDPERLESLVRNVVLSSLVVNHSGAFDVNHIPFVLDVSESGDWILRGHIPKSNPIAKLAPKESSCVVIFQGPSGYISPSYYASKPIDGKVVPTWNYSVVHCHGILSFRADKSWIMKQISDLTDAMESQRQEQWSVSDAPPSYTDRLAEALIGIEVIVERVEGKTKYSQNQPSNNQQSVLRALQQQITESSLVSDMRSVLDASD